MLGEAEEFPSEEGLVEVIQEMEFVLEQTNIPGEISLNAMAGNKSLGTVRLEGFIKKQKINILVDSGSTHSFIDAALVKRLGLVAEIIPSFLVTVADGSQTIVDTACKQLQYVIQSHSFVSDLRVFALGGSDVVLGVDWLQIHNPVTFDFNQVNITINKEGRKVVLQGNIHAGILQTISCKRLSKLMQQKNSIIEGYLFVISSCQEESAVSQVPTIHPPDTRGSGQIWGCV